MTVALGRALIAAPQTGQAEERAALVAGVGVMVVRSSGVVSRGATR
jgi:hypothetical protein